MKKLKFIHFLILIAVFVAPVFAEKIKEIANVIGVRDNQLIGYGLIIGLNGTGDGSSSKFTTRSLSNLLQTVNVKIDPEDIKSKNIAAVVVTAKLPPFARQGDALDVSISSIGDAKSIEGGTLLLTPLKGVDGKIYALAQGSLSIGGMNGKGGGQLNHATGGNIFGGAIVEREVVFDLYSQESASLSLKEPNFDAAISTQNTLNQFFKDQIATAIDPKTIKLKKPHSMSMVEFLAKTLEADINYIKEEKIVIDERTGTIVAGVGIQIDPVVITHGDITIKIDTSGKNITDASVDMKDGMKIGLNENLLNLEQGSVTVSNLTRALQKLGSKPKDVISILEAIKKAGAIRAKLEII